MAVKHARVRKSAEGIHMNMTETNNDDDTIRWAVATYVEVPAETVAKGHRAIQTYLRAQLTEAATPTVRFEYAVASDPDDFAC